MNIGFVLPDMTPEKVQAVERFFQKSKAIYHESCAFMDEGVEAAVRRLPQLEERKRGTETIHRYPTKNVDVMLALILVKIRGNIRAGEVLVESGFFLEWEMVQRTVQNSMEDVWFLLCEEGRNTKALRRYKASFFDEEIDKDGKFTERSSIIVRRPEIWEAIRESGIPTQAAEDIVEMGKRLQRLWSGSVHGRASRIINAYFEELTETRPWSAETHNRFRVFIERPSLYQLTGMVVLTLTMAGAGRWWDGDRTHWAWDLCKRMIDAIDNAGRDEQ